MKDLKFRVHSEKMSEAIQEKLIALGYSWMDDGGIIKYTKSPYLYASKEGNLSYGSEKSTFMEENREEISIEALFMIKAPELVRIKITDSYTAVVHKDKVVVGCQEIEHSAIHLVAEACLKLSKSGI